MKMYKKLSVILISLLIFIVISCNYSKRKKTFDVNSNIKNSLYSDLINAAIELDSLDIDSVKLQLLPINIDTIGSNVIYTDYDVSMSSILYFFKKYSSSDKDSIYIIEQSRIKSIQNLKPSNLTKKRFVERRINKHSYYYQFYLPILSYKKDCAFIQYWFECGKLCGECHVIVLKRQNNKWIKIMSYGCGVS